MMRTVALAALLVSCAAQKHAAPPDVAKDALPPPSPVVPVTQDDVRACTTLAILGCREAQPPAVCLDVFSRARTYGLTPPSACIADAQNPAMVRRCGDASTLRFECP